MSRCRAVFNLCIYPTVRLYVYERNILWLDFEPRDRARGGVYNVLGVPVSEKKYGRFHTENTVFPQIVSLI